MNTKEFFSERYAQLLARDPDEIRRIDDVSCGILDQVKEMLAGIKASTVLDYGCGVGKLLGFLDDVFGMKKYIGMDTVAAVINSNKDYFKSNERATFRAVRGEIKDKVDLVWTASTLQHMDDAAVEKVLANFAKILKKGGHLVVWANTTNAPDLSYMKRRSATGYIGMMGGAGFNDLVVKKDFAVGNEQITVMVITKK